MTEWKQERPSWCPHTDCRFKVRSQDSLCVGELPTPAPHDGDLNTHRMCQRGAPDDGLWLHKLEINHSDAWHLSRCLRVVFDLGSSPARPDGAAVRGLVEKWRDKSAEQDVKRRHWLEVGRSGAVAATHHARMEVYASCANELEAALASDAGAEPPKEQPCNELAPDCEGPCYLTKGHDGQHQNGYIVWPVPAPGSRRPQGEP